MRQRTFNPEGSTDLVFIMGWGDRWTYENVRWFIDRLAAADYRVHAFEIPRNLRDFKAEWLEPVAEYVVDLDQYHLIGQSNGGLIGQALDGADHRIYMSPFWGYPRYYPRVALDLAAALPTDLPFLPVRYMDRRGIGRSATDHQIATMPQWTSPTFVRETRRAQAELLEIDHDAVVFCSLSDPLIDLAAIGDRVPPEHVVLYEGGHELYSSPKRARYVELVLEALAGGADVIAERPAMSV